MYRRTVRFRCLLSDLVSWVERRCVCASCWNAIPRGARTSGDGALRCLTRCITTHYGAPVHHLTSANGASTAEITIDVLRGLQGLGSAAAIPASVSPLSSCSLRVSQGLTEASSCCSSVSSPTRFRLVRRVQLPLRPLLREPPSALRLGARLVVC